MRRPEDLLADLEQDIAWRDEELAALRRVLPDAESTLGRAMRRSMVPIVQAHAEGFVRFALRAYLRFISEQGPVAGDVLEVHVAWMLSKEFGRLRQNSVDDDFAKTGIEQDNKRARMLYNETRFLKALGELLDEQVNLDESPLDKLDQNLNKPYLLALLYQCGLDPAPHDRYSLGLNGLVMRRNEIAHGEHSLATVQEIDKWEKTVRTLFTIVRDEVFNAASKQSYLKV